MNFDILYNWEVGPLLRRQSCPQRSWLLEARFSDLKMARRPNFALLVIIRDFLRFRPENQKLGFWSPDWGIW